MTLKCSQVRRKKRHENKDIKDEFLMSNDHIGLTIKGNDLAHITNSSRSIFREDRCFDYMVRNLSFSKSWLQLPLICLAYLIQTYSNFVEARWPWLHRKKSFCQHSSIPEKPSLPWSMKCYQQEALGKILMPRA